VARENESTQGCRIEVLAVKSHDAKVRWLSQDEGGRSAIPDGTQYTTIAKFAGDGPGWPDGAWTIVMEFDKTPAEQGNPSVGRARFLMPAAPHERLEAGTTFDLYEGLRKVAIVEIV
jgi:hypothetical protein